MTAPESTRHYVSWFRQAAPYIHAFRGRTFVIGFGGEVAQGALAQALAQDCNLLAALGIRLVLVHGARPQIEEELKRRKLKARYHKGLRVTDVEALEGRDVEFRLGNNRLPFTAENFFMSFSLPNLHFHATTAYDILRMKGVPLGKRDYLVQVRVKT